MSIKVSVVIPCRNEVRHIETCVVSLLENGFPKDELELLVVDGLSDDGTLEKLEMLAHVYPQIRVIPNPRVKTPFALNLGIENARGSYILISSAHASFEQGYISVLFEKLQSGKTDVVGGMMKTEVLNKTATSLAIKKVLAHPLGVGNALFRTGITEDTFVDTVPFGLYKTDSLRKIGGYNEKLIRNHDIELSKRLLSIGVKIMLTPDTTCTYYAREHWSGLAKNNFQNGKWNLLTVSITRDFDSLSLRHFIPFVFVLAVISPLLLSLWHWEFLFLSFGVLALHLSALLLTSIRLRDEGTSIYRLLVTFVLLHWSYGLGSVSGFFSSLPNILFKKHA